MEYLAKFILLSLFIANIHGRGSRADVNNWFRDRHGNVVEINDYVATFTKARSSQSIPIVTNEAQDVLKMIADYQRSFILFMAGSYKSQLGRGPGNLYLLLTDKVEYCNGSVVAYEIAGDSVLANITTENRNTDVRMDFGHMGGVTISKALLTHVLKKVDMKQIYRNMYCREDTEQGWIHKIDVREDIPSGGGYGSAPSNKEEALKTYDTSLIEIFKKHNDILDETKLQNDKYIESLRGIIDRLTQKIKRLSPQTSAERIPPKPSDLPQDFESFIHRKINTVCTAKGQLPISKNITITEAMKWREDLQKKDETIRILTRQLEKIKGKKRVNLSNRFDGDEESNKFGSSKLLPYQAVLSTFNYTCLYDEEIDLCIDTMNMNLTIPDNSL